MTGVELIVLPEAYCCGLVGSKGKFCTMDRAKCKVQSHVKTKADVKRGYYLNTNPTSNLAWLDHHLPIDKVPDNLSDLFGGNLPLMDWIRVFTVLKEASEEDLAKLSSDSVTAAHTGKVSFAPHKTPRASRRGEEGSVKSVTSNDLPFISEEEDPLDTMKRGWNPAVAKVRSLNEDVGEIFATIDKLMARTEVLNALMKVKGQDEGLDDTAKKLFEDHQNLLQGLASTADDLGTRLQGEGMHEAVEHVHKRQKTLMNEVAEIAQLSFTSAQTAEELKVRSTKSTGEINGLIIQMTQVREILGGMAAALNAKSPQEESSEGLNKKVKDELNSKIEVLAERVSTLATTSMWTKGPNSVKSGDLDELKRRLNNFEKRSRAQAWEGGGQTFGHLEDVKEFVRKHMMNGGGDDEPHFNPFSPVGARKETGTELYLGCFYDIFSMMERVKIDAGGNTQDMFRLMGDVRKAGFEDGVDDAVILQSFNVAWPALLHKGGADLTSRPLNQVKTKDLWENLGTGQGLVPLMSDSMEPVLSGAMEAVTREYPTSPAVKDLVGIMNNHIRDFWSGAKTFVTSFFQELKHGSRASDQEAWDLIRDMLSSIFKEIHEARVVARGVATGRRKVNVSGTIDRAALVIWGTLQAARVMREVTRSEFKRHACVVPGLTLFLFNHRAPIKMVTDLTEKVAALEKERNGLKSEMHQLTAKVNKMK